MSKGRKRSVEELEEQEEQETLPPGLYETQWASGPYKGAIALVRFTPGKVSVRGEYVYGATLVEQEKWPLLFEQQRDKDAPLFFDEVWVPRGAEPERTWQRGEDVHMYHSAHGVWVSGSVVVEPSAVGRAALVSYWDWSQGRKALKRALPDELRSATTIQ